ncbi:MAG: class I SAM-dependent methyltransferase, partial [Patescibacteria group bacterium]|nr:class I SAM-dependent methyltransferase [Patescibacteria group bacterium]
MRADLYAELYEAEENHWWHRHKRAIAKQILEELKPSQGKVLDVGAGGGKLLSELQKKGWQSSGVDVEPKAKLQSQKRNLNIQIADATKKIPFKTDYFDAVFAVDSLEHMENDQKALQEIKRVTKPNGIIYISV